MAERLPGDGAAADPRRYLYEDEARMLYEAGYPVSPDMRVPSEWRLSAGGVPVPPPPEGADRVEEIQMVLAGFTANHAFWTQYFTERHRRQLEDTGRNGAVNGQNYSGGRSQ